MYSLYEFPLMNQESRYLNLFVTSISSPLSLHFPFLPRYPRFLKMAVFVSFVLTLSSFLFVYFSRISFMSLRCVLGHCHVIRKLQGKSFCFSYVCATILPCPHECILSNTYRWSLSVSTLSGTLQSFCLHLGRPRTFPRRSHPTIACTC